MGGAMAAGARGDLKQALRAVRVRVGFSLTVIATVALAIGATTSVFSVVDGVLLRPLDFEEPDRLVLAWQTRPDWEDSPNPQLRSFAARFPLSVPTFFDWQEARTGLESMGIYTGNRWVYTTAEGAELLRGLEVSSGVFRALGEEPLMGRYLSPDDDRPGAQPVLVLAHATWRDRFGADPEVVGRSISLDGRPFVVVGVMPEGFQIPSQSGEAWLSLHNEEHIGQRTSQSYAVLGRLAEGASSESVLAKLESVQARLSAQYPDEQRDMGAAVVELREDIVGDIRSTLFFLLAAVGLVLVIACVNIANMLSVSGLARGRELAVKAALGASRGQLVRALFAESAVLAVLGGVGGVILAAATLPALLEVLPASVPRRDVIGVDLRVLGFGLLVTLGTAVVVGMLPALQAASTQPKAMMDATSRGLAGGPAAQRVRSGLVVTEVALAFVLLVGAGLLATSFARLWGVDRGFRTEGLVAMTVAPNPVDFPEPEDRARFVEELRSRLSAIPGTAVTRANQVPLAGSSSTTTYYVDRDGGEAQEVSVMISVVDPDYLAVMEIAVSAGRDFDRSDASDSPPVALANRTLVERLWPGDGGVGQTLRADRDGPPIRIVGVVADVRHTGLTEPPEAKLYVPTGQSGRSANHWLMRVQGDPSGATELARQAVAALAPTTPVRGVEVLDERIASSVAVPWFRTLFIVGLALMATVLALLGVYGVVSFTVSQRVRELAVRLAIGAEPGDIVADTVARGLKLAAVGIVIGVLISWRAAEAIAVGDFLFEVDAVNPVAWLVVALTVALVGVLASWLPARRASRVDPVAVLKSE